MIKVDIGCGMRKQEGWVGIDIRRFAGVDYVLDIGKDHFPFETNSVGEIKALHILEHLYPEQLFHCMSECFRIITPKGSFYIEVPKAGTPAYYLHPDHKIQFIEDSFGFFQVPDKGEDVHGYLDGFWNVHVHQPYEKEVVKVTMYPNKPDGKFPFVQVAYKKY